MSTDSIPKAPRQEKDDPRTIGLWKVGRVIGHGGSGRVRLARHTKTHQKAAVKIVPKLTISGPAEAPSKVRPHGERLILAVEREIVIMKLVDHPNIMRLYDVWETSTHLFLILEYVEGGELFDYLSNKDFLTNAEALAIFQQVIAAVDYCHRFHIAHRDLKPENLLLDGENNIKVADFGMAAWQTDGALLNTACGSPHYAAPEVVMGKKYDGSAADVWSCGVILFVMLAGKLPFDDDDLQTLLKKVEVATFEMPADIDPLARDLLHKMLTKDPAKRITMARIFEHPFFLLQPPKAINGIIPNLDDISRPIGPITSIDPNIFANLKALWHDMPDEEILKCLSNENQNWQRGVYHLLVEYRAKKMKEYDEDEEKVLESLRARRRRRQEAKAAKEANGNVIQESPTITAEAIPPRAAPPTPRRAGRLGGRPSQELINLSTGLPMITLPSLSTESLDAYLSNLELSPVLPSSPLSPIIDTLIQLPRHDAVVDRYICQIIEHINTPQMKTVAAIEMARRRQASSTEDQWSTIGIADHSRRYDNKDENNEEWDSQDKENLNIRNNAQSRKQANRLGLDKAANTKRSSLRNANGQSQNRVPLGDRHVQIVEPEIAPSKLRKKQSVRRQPYSPVLSEESFNSPTSTSAPSLTRTWFQSVFNFRSSKFTLYSLHDAHESRNECRRLLMNMGARVVMIQSEGLGVLKCRLSKMGSRGIRLRVEVKRVEDEAIRDMGCVVKLVFVQEKGSQEKYKEVLERMRREWTFDDVEQGFSPNTEREQDNRTAIYA